MGLKYPKNEFYLCKQNHCSAQATAHQHVAFRYVALHFERGAAHELHTEGLLAVPHARALGCSAPQRACGRMGRFELVRSLWRFRRVSRGRGTWGRSPLEGGQLVRTAHYLPSPHQEGDTDVAAFVNSDPIPCKQQWMWLPRCIDYVTIVFVYAGTSVTSLRKLRIYPIRNDMYWSKVSET